MEFPMASILASCVSKCIQMKQVFICVQLKESEGE